MKYVYLSPHLDDAVLSCGGAMHRKVMAGDLVRVVTLFAGETSPEGSISAFAQLQHGYWGNPPRPMALRRGEDAAANALLGAETEHMDLLDAVYREGPAGVWLYPDLEAIFGPVHPADPLAAGRVHELAAHLTTIIPGKAGLVVYAPLALGGHVDHQVTHMAACQLGELGYRVAFYEDYPYAETPEAEAVTGDACGDAWRQEIVSLDVVDLKAKVAALNYYRTQLHVLFGSPDAMPSRVWAFAATRSADVRLAERIWWPQ